MMSNSFFQINSMLTMIKEKLNVYALETNALIA